MRHLVLTRRVSHSSRGTQALGAVDRPPPGWPENASRPGPIPEALPGIPPGLLIQPLFAPWQLYVQHFVGLCHLIPCVP